VTFIPHALLAAVCVLTILWSFSVITAAALGRGIVAAIAGYVLVIVIQMVMKRGPRRVK
jgi:hypothetical protein